MTSSAQLVSAVATYTVKVFESEVYRCPRRATEPGKPAAPARHVLVRKVDRLDMPPSAFVVEVTRGSFKVKEPRRSGEDARRAEERRRIRVALRLVVETGTRRAWIMPPPYELVRAETPAAKTNRERRERKVTKARRRRG